MDDLGAKIVKACKAGKDYIRVDSSRVDEDDLAILEALAYKVEKETKLHHRENSLGWFSNSSVGVLTGYVLISW